MNKPFNRQASLNEVGQLNLVEDFGEENLLSLAARVDSSTRLEHLVYREAELDEIWRLVDGAIREASAKGNSIELTQTLTQLREAVMKAHDLVGDDEDTTGAARQLRESVFLARKCTTQLERFG